ncbi:hypothetical protein [Actinoallomurus iriomotensis]|uniref:hypothetical protein n=1 Tax=Actinoallomurus iriomotensis TaxID=478107 RepID=UPI0025552C48|nr:hypothetical protein [Actinoallomurus iriomotensis]
MIGFRLSRRVRRIVVPAAAFAVGTVVAPVAAYAATGSFSSSSSTSTVTATNSGGGYALSASSTQGASILSTSDGTGSGSAMLLRQNASGDGSNALYAKTYTHTGTHYGVQGVTTSQGAGVLGQGTSDTGVLGQGTAGVVGQGTAYGVVSQGDGLVSGGNLYDDGGVSGVCSVAAGATSASCSFRVAFVDTTARPVVVVTPQGDPGGVYWAGDASAIGFTLNLASPAPDAVDFGYHVVGLYTPAAARAKLPSAAAAARPSRARR